MKNNPTKFSNSKDAAFAVPLSLNETMTESAPAAKADMTETDKRMLLFRLSDAASRIRDESNLIRRTGFTDSSSRLLRILAETVEEQRLALGGDSK